MYAERVSGIFLLPGNKIVNQDPPPQYIKKHLKPDPVFRPIHRSNINLNISRTDTFRIPVIYFQFPDQAVTYSVGDMDNLFNQEG